MMNRLRAVSTICVSLLLAPGLCAADNEAIRTEISDLELEIMRIDEMDDMIDRMHTEGTRIREQHCKREWGRFIYFHRERIRLQDLGSLMNATEVAELEELVTDAEGKYQNCFSRRIYGKSFMSYSGVLQYTIDKGSINNGYDTFIDIYKELKGDFENNKLDEKRRQLAGRINELRRQLE